METSSKKNQEWWKFYQKSRDKQRCIQIFILCVFISLLLRFILRSTDRSGTTMASEVNSHTEISLKIIKTLSKISFETTLYSQVLSNIKGDLTGFHKLPPKCGEQTDTSDFIDVTLVTQLSIDQLWMMQYHCQRWNHKISLIVYSQNGNKITVDVL